MPASFSSNLSLSAGLARVSVAMSTAMPAAIHRSRAPIRSWYAHLAHEWTSSRPIAPALAKPEPASWRDHELTAAWLGHSTVLINFFGFLIITDPVLFPRVGARFPGVTIGPKRLTAPALRVKELPPIDLVLLSHAHFDHFDMRTLHKLSRGADVVAAPSTADLLRWTRFARKRELRWGEQTVIQRKSGELLVRAFQVKHWGARLRHDQHRGYNGYMLERAGRRILIAGDTAFTDSFAALRERRSFDLAVMPIGAYDPWIHSHATPEQAIAMANAAGAEFIMPVHHQTFRLSAEPFREPIERFQLALHQTPERIALQEIGETFRFAAK